MDPFLLLATAEGFGPGMIPALLDPHSDPAEILAAPPRSLPPTVQRRIRSEDLESATKRWLQTAKSMGIGVLTPAMPDYPQRLRMAPLRPLTLFYRGTVELMTEDQCAVTVVGSRTATAYGTSAAWAYAGSLAQAGIPLWSGLAIGIDSIAHRACLRHGCPTVAVLAGGLDDVYPPQNRGLLQEILAAGGLCLSELPPGHRPGRGHFPRRNRILAQASDAILVVEAGFASGSLHTARYAAEAGVPVFAIPGPFSSPRSRGCHRLIAEGANIASDPESLLRCLGIEQSLKASVSGSQAVRWELSADEQAVLDILETGPRPTDLVARESGLQQEPFLTALFSLREKNAVLQLPGDLLALGESQANSPPTRSPPPTQL